MSDDAHDTDPKHEFDPKCEGCRPVMFDAETGQKLSDNDPVVRSLMKVWEASPLEDQQAFNRVAVHNSRDPLDMIRIQGFTERVEAEFARSKLN